MPMPATRTDLMESIRSSYAKLVNELETAGQNVGRLLCEDEWSVKDLLAVRAWWTQSVVDWIETGKQGDDPKLPARGYTWQQTPKLNAEIVAKAKPDSFEETLARLQSGFDAVLDTIDELTDSELFEPGIFAWAGKWPVARWLHLNTARQYTTARTLIRRAIRNS